jgi:hypothetical protein
LVIAAPPSLAGRVKLTVAWALPAVAAPIAGAPGAVAGGPFTVSVNDWLIDTALPVAAALMVKVWVPAAAAVGVPDSSPVSLLIVSQLLVAVSVPAGCSR